MGNDIFYLQFCTFCFGSKCSEKSFIAKTPSNPNYRGSDFDGVFTFFLYFYLINCFISETTSSKVRVVFA